MAKNESNGVGNCLFGQADLAIPRHSVPKSREMAVIAADGHAPLMTY